MYCKDCGKQIKDEAVFCNFCGAEQKISQTLLNVSNETDNNEEFVSDSSTIIDEQINDADEQKQIIKKHKIFHNENEVLIDTLGSGFISSLFVQESFSKSVIFCSNKRVYQRGKLFDRNYKGKITYYNGEKSVDLREITGISYYVDNPIYRFVLIIPAFIVGIIGFLIAQEQSRDVKEIISIISVVMIFIGIVSLIVYGFKKGKWFVIEYAGGMIMTNCNWYMKKSIKRFMRNVSTQKDKLFE